MTAGALREFNLQLSKSLTLVLQTRVFAPGLSAPGLATRTHGLFLNYRRAKSLSDLRPKGRTERRALWLPAASMHAKESAHPRLRSTSVHSRLHACAPHAVGLCGLLHVPGSAAIAHSPRSCELSPGHALGPSSVSPASHPRRRLGTAVPEASGARCRKDQPHPAPRIEDDRDAPSTGTGQGER